MFVSYHRRIYHLIVISDGYFGKGDDKKYFKEGDTRKNSTGTFYSLSLAIISYNS
jgi:hypothetical protein